MPAGSSGVQRCILCSEPLTRKADSKEHIVPNSIGGRKRALGVLCIGCNSDAGSDWDKEVADQTRDFCLLFDVTRDRGVPRPSTLTATSGRQVVLDHTGELRNPKPVVEKDESPEGLRLHVEARDENELRKIVVGLARKHPGIDVEKALKQAVHRAAPVGEPLRLQPPQGGVAFWRSGVKSMLALLTVTGGDPFQCREARAFLLGKTNEPCVGFFYTTDPVVDRPPGVPMHIVHVRADRETGLVLGYIEYFGHFRAVGCLSESYDGPGVEATYAVDPRSGEQLNLDVDLHVGLDDIQDAYGWKHYDPAKLQAAAEAVVGPAVEARNKPAQERLIDQAIREAMKRCGIEPDAVATPEQYACFSQSVAKLAVEKLADAGLIAPTSQGGRGR